MRFVNTVAELPVADLCIYGKGGRACELLDALAAAGRAGQVKCLADSFASGTLRGLPVLTRAELLAREELSAGKGRPPLRVVVASTYYREIVAALAGAGVEDILVYDPLPVRFLYRRIYASPLAPGRITVLDIGARAEQGDAPPQEWEQLDPEDLSIHGFDPDPEECARVEARNRLLGAHCRIAPSGLWSGPGEIPFHLTSPGSCSSCYPFNTEYYGRLRYSLPDGSVLNVRDTMSDFRETSMRVDSLDTLAPAMGLREVDLVKLDVQGAEREILLGMRTLLPHVLAAKVEVWFAPQHKGMPLFAEVDPLLRQGGLSFFALNINRLTGQGRVDSPVNAAALARCADHMGQLVTTDAFYFRDPVAGPLDPAPPLGRLLKLIVLAEAMHQQEFAFELLRWAARQPAYSPQAETLRSLFDAAAQDYAALAGQA